MTTSVGVAGAGTHAWFRRVVTGQLRLVLEEGTIRVATVSVLLVCSSLMTLVPVPAGIDQGWMFIVPVAVSAIGSGLREGLLVALGASLLCALYAIAPTGGADPALFAGVLSARFALLGLLAAVLGAFAEANRSVHADLRQLALMDPLTNVSNVTSFYVYVTELVRRKSPFALVMVDLDDLKVINDRFGHRCGSTAIRSVADALSASVRGNDCVARLGGDEFVVALQAADEHGARVVVERVRELLEELDLPDAPGAKVSVSAGISVQSDGVRTVEELLEAADAAMYRDKRARKVGSSSAEDRLRRNGRERFPVRQ